MTLSNMIDKPVPLEPTLLLLNDDSHLGLNEKQRKVWLAGLTAARKKNSTTLATPSQTIR